MSTDFDEQLRRALAPVDPGEGFDRRVLARVAREAARKHVPSGQRAPARFPLRWRSATAVAAVIVIAVFAAHGWHERREREAGLAARHQLIQALRVTSEKLDIAYQTVRTQAGDNDEEELNES